jgi:hypothetical protein
VIELTAEMEHVFYAELAKAEPGRHHAAVRRGLAAVLAIVARDHLRPAGPDRCSECDRTSRHLTPVTELVDGRTTVVARLGPSCYRRAATRDGGGRQALPIGDAP